MVDFLGETPLVPTHGRWYEVKVGPTYYNEIDPYCCEWLANLIRAGHLPEGDIDSRDIRDIDPADLAPYIACHFFAGLGGWPYALRLARWPARWPARSPVWTGSCPCQPFSVANVAHGGASGQSDRRHLLPDFVRLIGERRPPVVFGEQVPNAIKWGWLDEAFGLLEGHSYACAAAVVPALSVGAEHERARIYWVADSCRAGRPGYQPVKRFPVAAEEAFSVRSDPFARARTAVDGNYGYLLPDDGVSVSVERCAAKAYGNAIVPQVAAEFVAAYMEAAKLLSRRTL